MRQDQKHHSWTYEERDLLLVALRLCGKQWEVIQKHYFPDVTIQSVRNYYYHFRRSKPELFEDIDLDSQPQSLDLLPQRQRFLMLKEPGPAFRFLPWPDMALSDGECEDCQQQLQYSFSHSESSHRAGSGRDAGAQLQIKV